MQELKLLVPTYYGDTDGKPGFAGKDEFDEPSVPVLIREADGVRVVLGTHDFEDLKKPDIQIERRPNGWAIFLNPVAGGDTTGLVYFLDDGRSFLVPEALDSDCIQVLDRDEQVPLIDDPPANEVIPIPDVITSAAGDLREECPIAATQVPTVSREVTASESASTADPIASGANPRFAMSGNLTRAFAAAKTALVGDSNDEEHDALLALVEALDECELVKYREYSPEWLIEDFIGCCGLDGDGFPLDEDIRVYVREARPADSCPQQVRRILDEWSDRMVATRCK